jgi:hypothetical protein
MSRAHAYPPDLAHFVEANWPPERSLWLSSALFSEALSVAFQASLTSEEARPTRFRLLLTQSQSAVQAPTWGGRSVVQNWTYDPIVHVTAAM